MESNDIILNVVYKIINEIRTNPQMANKIFKKKSVFSENKMNFTNFK